jgi:hypothetical protein
MDRSTATTYCSKTSCKSSLVVPSGKFCKNKTLLGGRYSSGIWMVRRGTLAGAGRPDAAASAMNQDSMDQSLIVFIVKVR